MQGLTPQWTPRPKRTPENLRAFYHVAGQTEAKVSYRTHKTPSAPPTGPWGKKYGVVGFAALSPRFGRPHTANLMLRVSILI